MFGSKNADEIYEIFNSYLIAFNEGVLLPHQLEEQAFNTTVFKAIAGFFPIITARVQDRFGAIYSVDNYYEFTAIIGQRLKPTKISNPNNAYKPIVDHLEESLKQEFTL